MSTGGEQSESTRWCETASRMASSRCVTVSRPLLQNSTKLLAKTLRHASHFSLSHAKAEVKKNVGALRSLMLLQGKCAEASGAA